MILNHLFYNQSVINGEDRDRETMIPKNAPKKIKMSHTKHRRKKNHKQNCKLKFIFWQKSSYKLNKKMNVNIKKNEDILGRISRKSSQSRI